MTTKIIPGPWTISEYNSDTAYATIETIERGSDDPSKGYHVGLISATGADDPTARLIAAAPDLLAALQLCECELTIQISLAEQSNNPRAWHDAIQAARAAIAKAVLGTFKAEGGTPPSPIGR